MGALLLSHGTRGDNRRKVNAKVSRSDVSDGLHRSHRSVEHDVVSALKHLCLREALEVAVTDGGKLQLKLLVVCHCLHLAVRRNALLIQELLDLLHAQHLGRVLLDDRGQVHHLLGRSGDAIEVVLIQLHVNGAGRGREVGAMPAGAATLADRDGPGGKRLRARWHNLVVGQTKDLLAGHLLAGVAGVEVAHRLPDHGLLHSTRRTEEGKRRLVTTRAELVGSAEPDAKPVRGCTARESRQLAARAHLHDSVALRALRCSSCHDHAHHLVHLDLGDQCARGKALHELVKVRRLGLALKGVSVAAAVTLGRLDAKVLHEPLPAHHLALHGLRAPGASRCA